MPERVVQNILSSGSGICLDLSQLSWGLKVEVVRQRGDSGFEE